MEVPMASKRKIMRSAHSFFPVAGNCHDCGKPSRTYRCPECKLKFLKKYGYATVEDDVEPYAVDPYLHISRG